MYLIIIIASNFSSDESLKKKLRSLIFFVNSWEDKVTLVNSRSHVGAKM